MDRKQTNDLRVHPPAEAVALAITRCLGVGYALISRDYIIAAANPMWPESIGGIEGKPCYRGLRNKPDICPGCRLGALFATGRPQTCPAHEIKDSSGKGHRYEVMLTPVLNDVQGVIGALEIFKPVAGQRGKPKLGQLQPHLTRFIDFLPDPTFAIDLSGAVIMWNQAMEAFMSIKALEMLGKDDYAYAIPFYGIRRPMLVNLLLEGLSDTARQYAFVRQCNDALLAEGSILTPHGPRYIWGKAGPIYDEKGSVIGAVESLRDITVQPRTEQVLGERKGCRNGARQMEATGPLPDAIAHDFNNVLSAIIGYTELALDQIPLENQANAILQKVLKAGDKAAELVKMIAVMHKTQVKKG